MASIKELIERLHQLENERYPDWDAVESASHKLRCALHDLLKLPGEVE